MQETQWVKVEDVCHMYGMTYPSAKNRIAAKTFPVLTYKVGKIHVIDRQVHEEYFRRQRERCLALLRSTPG